MFPNFMKYFYDNIADECPDIYLESTSTYKSVYVSFVYLSEKKRICVCVPVYVSTFVYSNCLLNAVGVNDAFRDTRE